VDELHAAHPSYRFEVEDHGDGWGEMDADRIVQAITNLVSNAIQHSTEGAPIRVRTLGDADAVMLEVHNEGRPIPVEMIPVIFEPMRRGEPRVGRGHSIGLGLYIVSQIAHAHGGTIEVRSSSTEGTTFTLRLPRRHVATVSAPTRQQEEEAWTGDPRR
jgi:signal transduction histidine kinase